MRTPLVAGNWKMNGYGKAAIDLAKGIAAGNLPSCVEVLVCPPCVAIPGVVQAVKGSRVMVGAQNCHAADSGAFTGEVAPPMLKDAGCTHVIVGHSERRQYNGETDALINAKTKALLAHGLIPIVCVGETLAEREAGRTTSVVTTQVQGCLAGVNPAKPELLVVAYEPVWAIGTGKTATPEQAQEVHAHIRGLLAGIWGSAAAEGTRILYGGSMKADNAKDLMSRKDIDGGLVGGASLKADSFLAIIAGAQR